MWKDAGGKRKLFFFSQALCDSPPLLFRVTRKITTEAQVTDLQYKVQLLDLNSAKKTVILIYNRNNAHALLCPYSFMNSEPKDQVYTIVKLCSSSCSTLGNPSNFLPLFQYSLLLTSRWRLPHKRKLLLHSASLQWLGIESNAFYTGRWPKS